MKKTNYHMHTSYCDGKHSVAEMAEEAYRKGFKSIGFTSHFTMDYPDDCGVAEDQIENYIEDVMRAKEIYAPLGMDVLLGFEADYYLNTQSFSPRFHRIRDRLDYCIGSIHTMGYRPDGIMGIVDGDPEGFLEDLGQIYANPKEFTKAYYEGLKNMIRNEKPEIVGHLDLLKKNEILLEENFLGREDDGTKRLIEDCLQIIKETGSVLEINLGGFARIGKEALIYPEDWIIERAAELDIPLMLNGDTHDKAMMDFGYAGAAQKLKDMGIKYLYCFENGAFRPDALA